LDDAKAASGLQEEGESLERGMPRPAKGGILATGRERKVSLLEMPLEEPLSPELALVCPELAERARRVLPEPRWLAPVVRIESQVRLAPLQTLMLGLACILVTVTPLVLTVLAIRSPAPHH
jgi:hypothetical protein